MEESVAPDWICTVSLRNAAARDHWLVLDKPVIAPVVLNTDAAIHLSSTRVTVALF